MKEGRRTTGKITSWNVGKGFGFVTPNSLPNNRFPKGNSSTRIFVHINDFKSRHPEPAVGQAVSYVVGKDKDGRPCAQAVTRATDKSRHRAHRGVISVSALFAIAFVIALALSWYLDFTPLLVVAIYAAVSTVTFLAYAIDKSAAKHDRWRTKESTLHLLALIGGWPGAVAAQNLLRHKSRKREFREIFWVTVILNLAALVWLHSEYGAPYLKTWSAEFDKLLAITGSRSDLETMKALQFQDFVSSLPNGEGKADKAYN